MKLSKEMIAQIETIHSMQKAELFETYGDMIPEENAVESIRYIKEELAYLIYAVLRGKEPNELQRDLIYRHFQYLEMNDELKAYSHSKHTQRIIRRIYSDANI